MNDHTPGPWIVAPNGHCVLSDSPRLDGIPRGVAACAMTARSQAEAKANAQLVAAAPELLEAALLQHEADEQALAIGRLGRTPDPDQLQACINQFNALRMQAQAVRRRALEKIWGKTGQAATGSEVAA